MSKYLNRRIKTVFIVLGHACNNQCVYCMQHAIITKQVNTDINPDILDFLVEINDNQETSLHLQFFGGEPLIYFEAIEKIVKELEKRNKKFNYSVISNGKALTDKMVRFFNLYDFQFSLSWDGYNTSFTRTCDVLNDPILRKRFLKLKRFSITGVASAYSYPRDFIEACIPFSNEYSAIHGNNVYLNMDQLFDMGIRDRSLFDFDCDKIANQMKAMTENYLGIKKDPTLDNCLYDVYIGSLIDIINYRSGDGILQEGTNYPYCGNGYSTLNLDLQGNLYACHNTEIKVGTIYSDYFDYLDKILSFDSTRSNKETCMKCPAYAICYGGCPMMTPKIRQETYCPLKKAFFTPVIETYLKYKKDKKTDGREVE